MLKEGTKFDEGKLRFDLFPVRPLMAIANVLTFGAVKYADRNWEKGILYSRIFGGIMRHLWAWWGGEINDPESGLSHLAHASCGLLFLMEYEHTKREYDDREPQNYPLRRDPIVQTKKVNPQPKKEFLQEEKSKMSKEPQRVCSPGS